MNSNKQKLRNFKVIVISLFLTAGFSYAQNKTGTTIGQFLKIEPSSRITGSGNAGVSLAGEASLVYYNPASLGRLSGSDFQFTYNKWLADINYNYAVAAVNLGETGTFSLIVTSLNSGEIDVRTVEKPLGTGEKYTVSNFSLGLGYGLMLTDRVSVGIQLNYITETIWHSSLNAFGMNFGVQYLMFDGNFAIGASISNFGTKASYDGRDLFLNYDFDPQKYGDNDRLPAEFQTGEYALPTTFRTGLSYILRLGDLYKITFAADAIHPNDTGESINLGGEIDLMDLLSIRAGYRDLFLPDSEGGLVLGGGLRTIIADSFNVRFDYAYADYGILQEAHRITIGFGLK